MKKLSLVLLTLGLVFVSCEEGPRGPAGRDGFDGLDGLDGLDGEESFVFEYNLDFTAPEYSALLELPSTFNMLDSDVMLAFLLWEVAEDGTEIWRALPQTLYFEDGILEYNYDFTRFDASIFLDGTVNLDGLNSDYTDNWVARLVVVPGQFAGRSTLDHSDYNQVKEYYDLPPSKLATPAYTKRPQ